MPRRNHGRDRRAKGVAIVVAVLTAVGGGLIAFGLSQQGTDMAPPAAVSEGHAGHGGGSSEPSGSGSSSGGSGGTDGADPHAGHHGMGGDGSSKSPSTGAGEYKRPSGETMARSEPASVRIPSLDVSSSVIDLGVQSDKRMEVPQNGSDTGWFTKSPTPGELGPSILADHVTWEKKPAIFFDLGSMKKGQKVEVDRKDGSTATFEVTSVGQYPKKDFPPRRSTARSTTPRSASSPVVGTSTARPATTSTTSSSTRCSSTQTDRPLAQAEVRSRPLVEVRMPLGHEPRNHHSPSQPRTTSRPAPTASVA